MFKRVMAWLLCLVMLFAALPMAVFATDDVALETVAEEVVAEAAEVTEEVMEETTEEVAEATTEEIVETVGPEKAETIPASGIRQQGNYYYFKTFAELKDLASRDFSKSDHVYFYYEGGKDLKITENITLAENIVADWGDNYGVGFTITIPSGVTLTNKGSLFISRVNVSGKLVNKGDFYVRRDLKIPGKIENYNWICLEEMCTYSDAENVIFKQEDARVRKVMICDSTGTLNTAFATCEKMPNQWIGEVTCNYQDDIKLTGTLTIPANCQLIIDSMAQTIISEGCVLINNSQQGISQRTELIVKGKLQNNTFHYLDGTSEWAFIDFQNQGQYSGNGQLYVYVQDTAARSYTDYIRGLDLSGFEIRDEGDAWNLRSTEGLVKLGKPTDVTAGKAYGYSIEQQKMVIYDRPGSVLWKNVDDYSGTADVSLCKEDGTALVTYGYYVDPTESWWSANIFDVFVPESGKYYFTVQYVTDEEGYRNGDTVSSEVFTYTKPTKKTAKPTNLTFAKATGEITQYADFIVQWSGTQTRYELELFGAKSKTAEPVKIGEYGLQAPFDMDQSVYDTWFFREELKAYKDKYLCFRVRAISDDISKELHSDWSEMSDLYYYADTTVKKLSKPGSVKVSTEATSGKPQVSWKAVTNAETYEIYRATSKSGKYSKVGTTSDCKFLDNQATAGKSYYYKVRAVSGTVKSSYCTPVKGVCKCATPAISIAVNNTSGKVKISWEKVSGANKYEVYRSTKKTSGFKKLTTTAKTYYTDSSASVGTTYYYKVKAVASSSTYNSGYSTTVKAKRVCAQPDLSVKIASSGKPKLSWDKVSGAKEYRITMAAYDPETGEYGDVTTATTTSTSYTHKKAVVGVTYGYVVEAIGSKSGTNSVESNVKQITCVVAAPEIKVKADPDTGKPVVSWNENEDVHWYRVYRSTKSTSGFTIIGGGFNYNEKFVDNTATAGKKYYYKVVPVDHSLRAGVASEVVSCYADCAAPVVDGSLSSKKPKLTWGKVSGAKGYEVYRSTKKSSGFKKIKTITSTSYTDKSATTGKTYYYKVKAIAPKSSANSAYSDVLKITKSTKAKQISGYWKLEGLTTSGEELDKIGLTFSKEGVFLGASYYAAVPKDKVNSVLETGVINDGEGYLYCNDLHKFGSGYYYSMGFGGGAGGTYTESGKTVVVTIEYEQTGTMTLEKIAPNQYKVKNISGVIYDETVTEVIRSVGVFTYAP